MQAEPAEALRATLVPSQQQYQRELSAHYLCVRVVIIAHYLCVRLLIELIIYVFAW